MSIEIGLAIPIFVEHKAAGIVCVGVEIIVDATRFGARRRDLGGENAQQFDAGFRLGDNGPDDGDVCHQLPPILALFGARFLRRSLPAINAACWHRPRTTISPLQRSAGHVVLDEERINNRSVGALWLNSSAWQFRASAKAGCSKLAPSDY